MELRLASRSSLGGPDRRGFLADFPATGGWRLGGGDRRDCRRRRRRGRRSAALQSGLAACGGGAPSRAWPSPSRLPRAWRPPRPRQPRAPPSLALAVAAARRRLRWRRGRRPRVASGSRRGEPRRSAFFAFSAWSCSLRRRRASASACRSAMLPSDDDLLTDSGSDCARARAGEAGGVEASVSGAGAS